MVAKFWVADNEKLRGEDLVKCMSKHFGELRDNIFRGLGGIFIGVAIFLH